MNKLSSEQIVQVLSSVGPVIRGLTEERDSALSKLAFYERRHKAEKVASDMISRGLTSDPFEVVADRMMKAASETVPEECRTKLDLIQESINYAGPDMGDKIAAFVDNEEPAPSGGSNAFERYLLGNLD